jgi:hypothetical protein
LTVRVARTAGVCYWPRESTSVCLGSTPRAPRRVGGLWAFGRRFWLQGQ